MVRIQLWVESRRPFRNIIMIGRIAKQDDCDQIYKDLTISVRFHVSRGSKSDTEKLTVGVNMCIPGNWEHRKSATSMKTISTR